MRIHHLVRSISWQHAIGEVALIVVGILIALFIDDWVADKVDRQLEAEYLQALLDEANTDIENLQGNIRIGDKSYDSLLSAKRLVDDKDRVGAPKLLALSLQQGSLYKARPNLHTAVFDDLTSTGRLGLISDASVRRDIIDAYARMEITQARIQTNLATINPRFGAIVARHLPHGLFDYDNASISFRDENQSEEELKTALEPLLNDAELPGEILAQLETLAQNRSLLNALLGDLETYRDYLIDVIHTEP